MSDDPIRELLTTLPHQPFWAPQGYTVILEEKVLEAGGDPDAVLAWVEANGGRLDRTVPTARRSVFSQLPVSEGQRFYVVPESALSGDAAA
jgi:hypothetical protein